MEFGLALDQNARHRCLSLGGYASGMDDSVYPLIL